MDGADGDDFAGAAGDHAFAGGLAAIPDTVEIGAKHFAPGFGWHFGGRGTAHDAGIGNKNINWPDIAFHFREGFLNVVGIGHVKRAGDGFDARILKFFACAFEPFRIAPIDNDTRPCLREPFRECKANPLTRPRHERGFPI